MKFLADENIYTSTIRFLRSLGHDVLDVKELRLFGLSDDRLLNLSRKDDRILLTLDKDFVDLRYPMKTDCSILIVRVKPPTPENINHALVKFLERVHECDIKNALVILEADRYRLRRIHTHPKKL